MCDKKDDLDIRYHVVCLIDILGQKQRFAGWSDIPDDFRPTPPFALALQQTVGAVLGFRDMFNDLFETFDKQRISDENLEQLDVEQRQAYERYRDCSRLKTQQFSDTFVFYSPLTNSSGDLTVTPLYRIFGACCISMLSSLIAKLPLRGAVAIGTGTELEDGNFYGPALAKAHSLESEVAAYPRIIVSKEAVSFMRHVQAHRGEYLLDAMAEMAKVCESVVCMDTDNVPIVDFIGRAYQEIEGGEHRETIRAIETAYAFVMSERKRFDREGNDKLEERYQRLQKYIESRLNLWGLSPEGEQEQK